MRSAWATSWCFPAAGLRRDLCPPVAEIPMDIAYDGRCATQQQEAAEMLRVYRETLGGDLGYLLGGRRFNLCVLNWLMLPGDYPHRDADFLEWLDDTSQAVGAREEAKQAGDDTVQNSAICSLMAKLGITGELYSISKSDLIFSSYKVPVDLAPGLQRLRARGLHMELIGIAVALLSIANLCPQEFVIECDDPDQAVTTAKSAEDVDDEICAEGLYLLVDLDPTVNACDEFMIVRIRAPAAWNVPISLPLYRAAGKL
ncbi:hypothetical protein C8R44DRAFT_882133 [Mycena epipterygia]|nr:hypothetical protein C8R44DRAFT_882133 [Mycena epipterygia]